ncbi:K02A2.6-like, partial [Cordylochernes scorpioides]
MVNEGILQPIEYANWAAPIVPVMKKDGSLRICGNFRCTANKAIELDKYPLPSIDEIFSKLSGNTVFSSLDLSRAYLQVRLSEEAKGVVNINTTKGLFAFKRLPYGVAVAPNKFQRVMDNPFADMSGVACYIDDILVAGKDHRDHEQKLELVFKRLQEKGLRLNKDKYKFTVNAVEYLGFKIDKKGLHPISSKIEAVVEAPEPTNISQLRSFIGPLMYYSRVPSEGSSLVEIGAEINGKAIRNVRTTFEFCDLGFADYDGILGMPGIRALRLTMSHDGTITSEYEKKGDPCSSAFKSPIIAKELEALPPRLPIDQIRTGEDVVRAFPHCFCDGISDMGEGSTITAPELRMLSAKPIHKRQYPIPAITVPKVKALVKELEEVGIVEECTSLWNSPLFPVAKSDGSVRITLDLRLINDATEFFPFPMPRVEDNLRAFAGAKVFSTLDLTSGFFQIHIPECDRDYFAFSLPWGRYRFARLAQGAKNSAQIFQWAMNIVLGDLLFKCVRFYIDDVIVYSSSFEQHVADLAAVLERLNKFRLRAKRAKSYFFRDSVEYLGHTIDQEGIKPLCDNVAALRDMPRPKNIRAVRSLLGMVNYYRRFVPNAGEVLAPLSNLLKKEHKFFWGTAEQAAFEIIKKVLTSEPVLVHPVPSKPFILNTDASGIAVGACLQQEVQGVVKPVAYYSKRLSGPETRYSTIEKEAYAVVLALQHFKHLIAGSSIEVLTDHKPITYKKGSDYKNARLSRWAEIIQEFRVTFAYVPGKDNRVADFLSRFPCSNDLSTLEDNRVVAAVTIEQGSPLLSNDEVWSELKRDPKWSPLITRIETRVGTGIIPHKHKEYMRKDGCLYVYNDQGNWVKVIPRSLINRVMGYHHNIASAGHFGVRKTLRRLRSEYFWPRMRTEVQNYIRRCENCQFSNQGASKAANAPHFRPMQRFEHIAIDFIGPLETTPRGHNSILSIMDLFTKYPILVPTRDQTAGTVVKALVDRVITHHGVPKTVLSDRGSAFISQVFKGVCKALGISAVNTTAWRPQSNGAVERQNRTVIESLRRCACGSNWDNILSMVAFAIRSTEHASTGYTTAKLLYGYELRQPQPLEELRGYPIINDSINHYATAYKHQIAEKMETAREKVRQTYLKGQDEAGAKFAESKLRIFPEGQLVLVERMHETKGRHKLEPRYEGPFLVLERTGETVYLLEDTKSGKRDKFHVDRMKAYYEPIRTYPLNSTNNQEQESEEDEEFCSTNPGFVNFFYPLSKSAVPPSSNQTAQVQSSDNGQNSSAIRRSTRSKTTESLDEDQVLLLRKMSEVPFSFQDVAVETRRDRLLSIVLKNVRENNWQIPKVSQENPLYPYYRIKDELSCEFGCLQWRERVDITSRTIIGHLREIFARFGLPEILVTDNGRQFVSSEFEEFTTMNGIRHTKTSPYNPSTNGLAERYVREFKNSLRKNQGKDSIEINLQRFLFTHRAFPQTVLKESPAELLMKRSLRSRFSNLIPKMAKVGEVYHDAVRKQEHFSVGSDVYFRGFANGPKWKRGRIMELLSSRHYLIEDEGRYVKRHINQLRPVIKKEVPEVRDLVLLGTSRDFILPGTSRDHPRLGGQEKEMEKAPEVDEELKGAESSAQEDTPEPGPAAAAVSVP